MSAPGAGTVPLADLLGLLALPAEVDGVVAALGEALSTTVLTGITTEFSDPAPEPGDPPPEVALSEEDYLGALEAYDDGQDLPAPPAVDARVQLPPAPLLDLGDTVTRLRLESLGGAVVPLPVGGLAVVVNPGGLEVTLRSGPDALTVSTTLRVALRVPADVLVPMRPTGPDSFETDTGVPQTQIDLGAVTVTLDAGGRIEVGGEFHLALPHPVMLGDTGIVVATLDLRIAPTGTNPHSAGQVEYWTHLLANATLTVGALRLVGPVMPRGALGLEAKLVLRDGALDLAESHLRRVPPGGGQPEDVVLRGVHVSAGCMAVEWNEVDVGQWLGGLLPDLGDAGPRTELPLTAQVLWGEGRLTEIRLDWHAPAPRPLRLPGVAVTISPTTVTVLVHRAEQGLRGAVLLTLDPGSTITATADLAWERGPDRELQQDATRDPEAAPFFGLTVGGSTRTLVLLDVALSRVELPTFLQQVDRVVSLAVDDPSTLGTPITSAATSLRDTDWTIEARFDLDRLTLPFLHRDGAQDPSGSQSIELRNPTATVDIPGARVGLSVDVLVRIGPLTFDTDCALAFNWETFALSFSHDDGIRLSSTTPQYGPTEHLGLRWTVSGAPDPAHARFHYFTLVTRNGNYQVQQAPGARIEIEYTKVSTEPITFVVTDFALGNRGLTITAEVQDRPVKLNGLDTRFRFSGSTLRIVENRIADLTLAGSGPLPPALVGDAVVDVALQFHQPDHGALTLVAGSARLQGRKPLRCEGTRFEFTVDALGLKFVDDGRFHLYVTLTGSARFRPASGDDADGALALLGAIGIDLVDCPLTGDTSVLAQHVTFLVELPKPRTFDFLGCFAFELRAIGFVPSAAEFDGDAGMEITGQLKFAQGPGDTPDPRADYHRLLIGLPAAGSVVPRIHFKHLSVNINLGAAFRLSGAVEFVDDRNQTGMLGEGMLQIQGLPTVAASFGFLRVRRDEQSPWVRAWFIYLEIRRISFPIPVVQLYLREVGLGFGYRFTIAGIRAADQAGDVRRLVTELQALSRTQGDLSHIDRWALDLEAAGEDPRWTIVLRAMISQASAAPSPLSYNHLAESQLPCTVLFDAVIAFRSDLTFLMVVRAWLNTNYADYVENVENIRERPLLSGFVLLSVRQRRFLAHVANTPGAKPGLHPPLPEFVRDAIASSRFSATILIQPGLVHQELGWPNMLRWSGKIGPLTAEFQGGAIFRVSRTEIVIGQSFLARARLALEGGVDLGFVGAKVTASATVSFGARFIGVVDLVDLRNGSALYGAIGIEAQIVFAIELWLKIPLGFTSIKLPFRFSLAIGFTAALEIGMSGLSTPGLRGVGTVSISAMGHDLQLSVKVGANEQAVDAARARTDGFLDMGLEATEVEPVPGLPRAFAAVSRVPDAPARPTRLPRDGTGAADGEGPAFAVPGYSVFTTRSRDADGWTLLLLLPSGEQPGIGDDGERIDLVETGFLPPPPTVDATADFVLTLPTAEGEAPSVEQFDPATDTWQARAAGTSTAWRADWDAEVVAADDVDARGDGMRDGYSLTLRRYLSLAFRPGPGSTPDAPLVAGDPRPLPTHTRSVVDPRVQETSDNSYEAAVRGAFEQFRGSPLLKHDTTRRYDRLLADAFDGATTVYAPSGRTEAAPGTRLREDTAPDALPDDLADQQAHQMRGMIVHDIVADLADYTSAPDDAGRAAVAGTSIAFRMGLVLRVRADDPPAWLERTSGPGPTIRQRSDPAAVEPGDAERPVRTFNVAGTDYAAHPPRFRQVAQRTDAATISLSWDLAWDHEAAPGGSSAQRDPEHHLQRYDVRRRCLDGSEPDAAYTVKNGDVLHREQNGSGDVLHRLRPRHQVVDHFPSGATDLAALPANGRSYLYTVVPVDFTGAAGRPLTVVATRYPSDPPPVPADGELVVAYRLGPEDLASVDPKLARVLDPHRLTVEWSEPPAPPSDTEAPVPVARRRLVLRREPVVPVGSYGLDSATQRPAGGLLPTSNARALATDVRFELPAPDVADGADGHRRHVVRLDPEDLRRAGVLPRGPWRPEAWRAFLQTESVGGVPSALAPVALRLVVDRRDPAPEDVPPEVRRPAELEWLPTPVLLPPLPARDQQVESGIAHVVLPRPDGDPDHALRFTGDLAEMVAFAEHPARTRALRFRWNRGRSDGGYPVELHAGFSLREVDLDATTTRAGAADDTVRTLQEIQMLPAGDLLATPGDTLAVAQWEAWYPSTVRRRRRPLPGADSATTPWYSWRDSMLVWPAWPSLTDGDAAEARRDEALHPFLARLVDLLDDPADRSVAIQTHPPAQPGDLAAFLAATAPATDPYGWGVLQRFGLSVTVTLHGKQSGEVLDGGALVSAVRAALDRAEQSDAGAYAAVRDHLHVELLVQPGASVRLAPGPVGGAELLGLVSLSLRPTVRQYLGYSVVHLTGPVNAPADVVLVGATAGATVLDRTPGGPGPVEIAATPDPIRLPVRIALDGRAELVVRAPVVGAVEVAVTLTHPPTSLAGLEAALRYEAEGARLVATRPLDGDLPDRLRAVLDPQDHPLVAVLAAWAHTSLPVTDDRSAALGAPVAEIARRIARGPDDLLGDAWERFRRHLHALNSTDRTVAQRIEVPVDGVGLEAVLPDLLTWSARFFDAGGALPVDDTGGAAVTEQGPWVATAWPRTGTPAAVAPDEAGVLAYVHLLTDRWAHTSRYSLVPSGRYDLLWRALRTSPVLTDAPSATVPPPDPLAPGTDVVLDRTAPPAPPLVLLSGRLDRPAPVGRASEPGRTWEVVVAEHPEQALVRRNQTLARRLAYRGLAVSLSRRLAHPGWPALIAAVAGTPPEMRPVEPTRGDVPGEHPALPDTVDTTTPLAEVTATELGLTERLGAFAPGVIALQWRSLPFYYEHRLLLAAQAGPVASSATVVTQRDFEYRSPTVSATLGADVVGWTPPAPFGEDRDPVSVRARVVRLPLARWWDSLPDDVQRAWPSERPDPPETAGPVGAPITARKPGAVPDPDVAYEIVERFGGNVEVQAEITLDATDARPVLRQLGRRLIAQVVRVVTPSDPLGDVAVEVLLLPVVSRELHGSHDRADLDLPTRRKVLTQPGSRPGTTLLTVAGDLTAADRDGLLALVDGTDTDGPADAATIRELFHAGDVTEPVSLAPEVPPALAELVEIEDASEWTLVWSGPVDEAEAAALAALPGDTRFRAALAGLAAGAAGAVGTGGTGVQATCPPAPEPLPPDLATSVTLPRDGGGGRYTGLTVAGPVVDDTVEALRRWARLPELLDAVDALLAGLDAVDLVREDLPPLAGRPSTATLPLLLTGHVELTPTSVRWRGRPASSAVLDALVALGDPADVPFREALQALRDELEHRSTTVPLDVARRPDDLPPVLREGLLVGRHALRAHGPLAPGDIDALHGVLPGAPDRAAVDRLARAALEGGRARRAISLRTRRGAAPPSPETDVTPGAP